ncbi:hypothetical protein DH2020_032912 [Rehmannia glutinosa]|uniref:Uncharacterized protein n=1 Tax=Rehmannia glutinosa TaxID=99300 RepID=A0ABR0VE04_REHGL
MDSDNLITNCQAGEMEENGGNKIYVSDGHVNGVQQSRTINSDDSFVVDMRRLSHLTEKDINSNSRITVCTVFLKKKWFLFTQMIYVEKRPLKHIFVDIIKLQRNLSRKGCSRGGEKKIPSTTNQRNATMLATSPTAVATLRGGVQLEKPVLVSMGPTEPSVIPQVHHQITISNGAVGSAVAECKRGGKRFGFRHSQSTWSIDPRRILMFYATL